LVGAPVLPRYARKYPMGLYEIGDMLLYTNRGLGMLPPFPLPLPTGDHLARPECVTATLRVLTYRSCLGIFYRVN
jgi:hypothetical protein